MPTCFTTTAHFQGYTFHSTLHCLTFVDSSLQSTDHTHCVHTTFTTSVAKKSLSRIPIHSYPLLQHKTKIKHINKSQIWKHFFLPALHNCLIYIYTSYTCTTLGIALYYNLWALPQYTIYLSSFFTIPIPVHVDSVFSIGIVDLWLYGFIFTFFCLSFSTFNYTICSVITTNFVHIAGAPMAQSLARWFG